MLPSAGWEEVVRVRVRVWVGRLGTKLVVSDVAPQASLKRPGVAR